MPATKKLPGQTAPYVKVALPLPVTNLFTYEVPPELAPEVFVGRRVEVPFGRRLASGVVVELADKSDFERTKPIKAVMETYLSNALLELVRWMASYYGCSIGEAAQAALPPSMRRATRERKFEGLFRAVPVDGGSEALRRRLKAAPRQLALAERLFELGGEADLDTITGEWSFAAAHIKALLDKGIAERCNAAQPSPFEDLETSVTELTPDQRRALDSIEGALASKKFSSCLLHGVTGSGKTEVYLRSAAWVLSRGGGCIVLVPEISLLPQAVARYRRVFGERMAVIHSRLTGTERFEIWDRTERGECRLVLGPRSAVFSPLRDLRLIVVDEEQDDSYKQEDKPRYHARNAALMRGKLENLTVVLGSATPSAESLHHALEKRYTYLSLPSRVGGAPLPAISLVDLKVEPLEAAFCSAYLVERLEKNVREGHQSILFLNKRGHSRFIQCNACGWTARCKNCDIALIYHRVANRLKCHYCGYNKGAVSKCEKCGGTRLFFSGAGTQRVELDLAALLPGVRILRMDADTTAGKEGHRRVLEQFSTGKYPVLIGTQMVSKGHHFPNVNLVGVLYAEESLNYPDFRSAERTFQQLTQVAGRAGRGGGDAEVVVQTFAPDHYVFKFLREHDYAGFMKEELAVRRELRYPPFSRIVLASFSAARKDVLDAAVIRWTEEIRQMSAGWGVEILGPAAPPVERVKNRYREHVLIKGPLTAAAKNEFLAAYRRLAEGGRRGGGGSIELRWDVDPESFG
jgi:primosomal protein N' (replication factor Y) (superfamily II helicase)